MSKKTIDRGENGREQIVQFILSFADELDSRLRTLDHNLTSSENGTLLHLVRLIERTALKIEDGPRNGSGEDPSISGDAQLPKHD
jgi:hypothetical protein